MNKTTDKPNQNDSKKVDSKRPASKPKVVEKATGTQSDSNRAKGKKPEQNTQDTKRATSVKSQGDKNNQNKSNLNNSNIKTDKSLRDQDIKTKDNGPQNVKDEAIAGNRDIDASAPKKVTVINPKNEVGASHVEKLKRDDLLMRVKASEEKLKAEKEEKKKLMESIQKEMENKDRVITSIAGTNKKLLSELDNLKKEVDEKLDKIDIRQKQDREKEKEKKKSEMPIEQVLKVKEKDLKNTINMIEAFKRDKENLAKQLADKVHYERVLALEDKLRQEETKSQALEKDVKALSKMIGDHKKCDTEKEMYENEKKVILSELKELKEKNKEVKGKIKEEEQKQSKLNELLVSYKNESKNQNDPNKTNLPDINQNNPKAKSNLFLTNPAEENDCSEQVTQNIQTQNKKWNNSRGNQKLGNSQTVTQDQSQSLDRKKQYTSFQNKNLKTFPQPEKRAKLFGKRQTETIQSVLAQKDIDALEIKFVAVDLAKGVLEKQFLNDKKVLLKKVSTLEQRIGFSTLQNKENDQKKQNLAIPD